MKKFYFFITLLFIFSNFVSSQISDHFLYIRENSCSAVLPNYVDSVIVTDNCELKSVIQTPTAGTILDATNPQYTVSIIATDVFDNISSATFTVTLLDTIPPLIMPKYTSFILGHNEVFPSKANTKQRRAIPVISPNDGTITYINIYHGDFSDQSLILGVYSDLDGQPDTLIASTEPVPFSSGEGWQRVPVITQSRIYTGQKVWIAFNSTGLSEFRYATGFPADEGRVAAADNWTFEDGMPFDFGGLSGDPSTASYSVYLEYLRGYISYSPQIIWDMYKIVEQYIAMDIQDLTHEFDWSTFAIDTVLYIPKYIPANLVHDYPENK